ncbi:MAG TPA: TetR/AcrR family transcriptional regulator [Solirubrobacterales bacterium]|jgi:AcrR family transcriptional regulator|nr:TetR/AcrR family transcriptional regulator [Solirubrobacterales bacterium]
MPASPITKKGLLTRAKILEAAREVFARAGYVDARMTEIAESAGLSTGGLYRYFEDKKDVFAALIEDLHEELYRASGRTTATFKDDPLSALFDANRGYVEHYFENRDVMRAFIEAAGVDQRFRSIWWHMRQRHVKRFATAMRAEGVYTIDGSGIELVAEAMACMVEQCCYVWFAHEDMRESPVSLEDAVRTVTNAWYGATLAKS